MDGAFKAVERVTAATSAHLECLVVVISADVAACHIVFPSLRETCANEDDFAATETCGIVPAALAPRVCGETDPSRRKSGSRDECLCPGRPVPLQDVERLVRQVPFVL